MAKKNVYLIGNGSLGSFAAIGLSWFAEIYNWNLRFIDFDKVEEHNLRNQFFRPKDVGEYKALALAELLSEFRRAQTTSVISEANSRDLFRGTVIVLVDSMKARKTIFSACRYEPATTHYIEARSGGGMAIVYSLDPRDPDCVRRYERTFYDDSEALPAPCATPRQTSLLLHVAGTIAELAGRSEERKGKAAEFVQTVISAGSGCLPSVISESYTGFSH